MNKNFSRWYGLGGGWIKLGLPHFVQMYQKIDAVCKIQDSSCGKSMVMPKLKLVKGNTTDEAAAAANGTVPAGYINHGTK